VLATSVRRRYSLTWFTLGLLVGGALTATLLTVMGAPVQAVLPPSVRWGVVGLFAVALGLRAAGALDFPLPENRRLVPETVFRTGPAWSSLQFGVEMGSGVRTYVTSALPYLLAVAVICLATPMQAWASGAGFAAGRALMTVASTRGGDPASWRARWSRTVRLVAALLASAVAASLALLAWVGGVPA
jgi:hypothetical protein